MNGVHSHKCGYSHFADLTSVGCGFVWSHAADRSLVYLSVSFVDQHKCPRCGAGPFYSIYEAKEELRQVV